MHPQAYDPARHDTQLVAAFEHRQRAEHAQRALVGAGLPAAVVEVVDAAAPHQGEGFWLTMRRLFAPDEEVQDLSKAIRNGRAILIVHPQTAAERETAIEVLEAYGPIDLDEQVEPARPELNHASHSRADLIAAGTPRVPADPPPPPPTPAPPPIASHTYGVPEMARSKTAAEQVSAQAPSTQSDQHSVRIVEEPLRDGWRDRSDRPSRVRLYVAERSTNTNRVRWPEEEIPDSTDRSTN